MGQRLYPIDIIKILQNLETLSKIVRYIHPITSPLFLYEVICLRSMSRKIMHVHQVLLGSQVSRSVNKDPLGNSDVVEKKKCNK